MPLAVVGSNVVIEVNGKKVRGRQYPWGVAEGRFTQVHREKERRQLRRFERSYQRHVLFIYLVLFLPVFTKTFDTQDVVVPRLDDEGCERCWCMSASGGWCIWICLAAPNIFSLSWWMKHDILLRETWCMFVFTECINYLVVKWLVKMYYQLFICWVPQLEDGLMYLMEQSTSHVEGISENSDHSWEKKMAPPSQCICITLVFTPLA